MARLVAAVLAGLAGVASGVSEEALAEWASSSGLVSPSESRALAQKEYKPLSYARASIDGLSKLKGVLSDQGVLNLSTSEVRANIFHLASARVNAAELQSLYNDLVSVHSAGLPKRDAQAKAMKLARTRSSAKNITALWSALYSVSGLNLNILEAQRWVVDLTAAGTDAERLKPAYKSYISSREGRDVAVTWAVEEAVSRHLDGLPKRYAVDGSAYTAHQFQTFYADSWLSEWLAAPEERRTAKDGNSHTAAEFKTFFGDYWASWWSASPVTVQKRLAADGKIYALEEFASYYAGTWQREWDAASEVADDCAFLTQEACAEALGCVWAPTGDWTESCVVQGHSADNAPRPQQVLYTAEL